jgi:hypothetical protein
VFEGAWYVHQSTEKLTGVAMFKNTAILIYQRLNDQVHGILFCSHWAMR